MRTERLRLIRHLIALFTFISGLFTVYADAERFKDHILVVFNSANPESDTLAHYYAQKRNIDSAHILGVRASDKEEISRDQYNDDILKPIDAYVVNKHWLEREPGHSPFGDQQLPVLAAKHNDIWVIVLMYGMPLKIVHDPKANDATPSNAALNSNAATVDSELTMLPYQGLPITGLLPNPYQLVSYDRPFDGLDAKHMVMVTRLDASSPSIVRRMIDDSIFAEKTRLVGDVYLDSRGVTDPAQPYYVGDKMLGGSAKIFRDNGWHVDLDSKPEMYPANLPWTNVAFYAGWYGSDAAGPFMKEGATFSPGAIAYPIHSFGATTLHSEKANWCGPLLYKGVAATMGAVSEPYLDYMPQWDTFVARLHRGYTFAESAYASQKALSWLITIVGDPLYTPFAVDIDTAISLAPTKSSVRRDMLLLQKARIYLNRGETELAKNTAEKASNNQYSTFAAWEGYAEIMSDPRLEPLNSTVAQAYERAFNLSITVEDQIRTGMKCADAYKSRFRPQEAMRILGLMLSRYPNESVYYGAESLYAKLQKASPNIAPSIDNKQSPPAFGTP